MKLSILNWTFHLYRHNQTNTERYKRFYKRRRKNQQCVRCGKHVTRNPHTKSPYRYCIDCRADENKRKKIRRTNP